MDFLLISIEAINLYNLDENYTYKTNSIQVNTRLNNLFLIRCGNLFRHPSTDALYSFTENIKAIYYINRSINNSRIQKTINKILIEVYNDNQLENITKYLNRFKYIYYKTQNYYNIRSKICFHDQYMQEIAIFNLYIISILRYKDGIYFLIKYLKSPYCI
uniref:hypothetical protein n=1 Tax=Gracilaria usneoides TaxID=172951 RepID=UPI001D111546|nr:hypothetical protein LK225_pgp009 [Crassiphycus usneoides]UAD88736.1 hypothetical protein [Crassiphycus usneoides]